MLNVEQIIEDCKNINIFNHEILDILLAIKQNTNNNELKEDITIISKRLMRL